MYVEVYRDLEFERGGQDDEVEEGERCRKRRGIEGKGKDDEERRPPKDDDDESDGIKRKNDDEDRRGKDGGKKKDDSDDAYAEAKAAAEAVDVAAKKGDNSGMKTLTNATWAKRLEQLRAYKSEHGHTRVPRK